MAATNVLDSYLTSLPGESRRLAHGEWGLTSPPETLGEPLDIGLSIADGLLRAKAPAGSTEPGLDPWMLLWWNRQTRLVRFACTRSREILPVAAVEERAIDRLLGLVVEGVVAVRSLPRPLAHVP